LFFSISVRFLASSLRVSGVCGFTAFVDPPLPFSTAQWTGRHSVAALLIALALILNPP
jgi:hypothetical protein